MSDVPEYDHSDPSGDRAAWLESDRHIDLQELHDDDLDELGEMASQVDELENRAK